ncbi:MAG: phosphohydrolase [Dictyoglomus sp. NZ13-RE01]|nr:MAG: phosphohydrolase [Dictyoglomus sp. NZ13-RE01]
MERLKRLLDLLLGKNLIDSYGLSVKNHKDEILNSFGTESGDKLELNLEKTKITIHLNLKDQILFDVIGLFLREITLLENNVHSLEEKINELKILQEISNKLNSTLQLHQLLSLIMQLSKETLNAEASSLMLLDKDSNSLIFEVALGEKGDIIKQYKIPLGEGIAGWVALTGEPIIVNDVRKDPRFAHRYDSLTSFQTRSILCVPLKTKEEIIGVIEVLNKIGMEGFDEEDLNLLYSIANQAAIAIENAKLYKDLKELFFDVVETLASAIDAKDPYTHGHSRRVSQYSELIAKEMGLNSNLVEKIKLSALLHDIGKIGISENILLKKSELSQSEREEIKKHPSLGKKILEPLSSLEDILPGIEEHHERYDGKGYPKGLKGEEISILGRIIAIADALDAMTSDRPYRKALSMEDAIQEIENQKGKQFDPEIVPYLISLWKKGLLCSGS